MVAVFSPSSILRRLMASPFLPSSASWPRRHGEFSAQLVFVGLDLRHGKRRGGFQPPHGQADGAAVNERDDHQPYKGGNQKADPEIHDRFNHETTPPTPTRPSARQFPAKTIA
jgi:hypothetical protein